MIAGDEPDLRYGIDRMVARGRRIFGWGWVAHPSRPIASVALSVASHCASINSAGILPIRLGGATSS